MVIGKAWATGAASAAPAPGSIPATALEDGVLLTNVRRGALFQGGAYGSLNWAPTTAALEYSFIASASTQTPLSAESLLGRNAGGRVQIRRTNVGQLQLAVGVSNLYAVPNAFLADGVPHEYRFVIGVNTQEIYRDGVLLGSGTATFTHLTTATTTLIGGATAGADPGASGITMWDVRLIDPASSANTAYFPLDGRDSSGNFPNEAPGSTVADATVTGLVQFAQVLSSDGGRALPVGRMVYLHSGFQFSNTTFTSDGSLNSGTVTVNESGGAIGSSTTIFTAPTAGVVRASGNVSLLANSAALDSVAFQWSIAGSGFGYVNTEVGTAPAQVVPVVGTAAIGAGQSVVLGVSGVAGGTSFTVDYFSWSIDFYPTAP